MDLCDIGRLSISAAKDDRERVRMLTERLPDDCEVYLQGLTTNSEYNNKLGVVKSFDGERYIVSVVEAGVSILVEAHNLKVRKTFEPQLFVRISAKNFTQPTIFSCSHELSVQQKINLYYTQCSDLAKKSKASDTVLAVPIKDAVFQQLRPNDVLTPMYFVLNKQVLRKVHKAMVKLGAKWATVCTELHSSDLIGTIKSKGMLAGECEIIHITEDCMMTQPRWILPYGDESVHVPMAIRYFLNPQDCMK